MHGPLGRLAWKESSSPSHTHTAPISAASGSSTGNRLLQKRAAAAGNIISPTTISAPMAWLGALGVMFAGAGLALVGWVFAGWWTLEALGAVTSPTHERLLVGVALVVVGVVALLVAGLPRGVVLRGLAVGAAQSYPLGVAAIAAAWVVSLGLEPRDVELSHHDLTGVKAPGLDLEGASLGGVELRQVDLTGATLAGAELRGARVVFSSLEGADLRGAHLKGARVGWGVDLSGADLRGAALLNAHLDGVNLSGADLRGVTLRGARLERVDLSGADLRGASLGVTGWFDVNLSGANLSETRLNELVNALSWREVTLSPETICPSGRAEADEPGCGFPRPLKLGAE